MVCEIEGQSSRKDYKAVQGIGSSAGFVGWPVVMGAAFVHAFRLRH
jgi:hypothetical protein